MARISFLFVSFLAFFIIVPGILNAQISAPGASGSDKTNYPVFSETDSIFVFCAAQGEEIASLRFTTGLQGTKTFLWEKYNTNTQGFEFYFSESSDVQFSEINGLADGCYRITTTQAANSVISRAWVFNNWIEATASLPDSTSTCESFQLVGEFTAAELKYYDISNNAEVSLFKDTKIQWEKGQEIVATVLSPRIFSPPTANTEYTLTVYDKFNCEELSTVTYNSIVTKAEFRYEVVDQDIDPYEAPATVNFINESENGDPGRYEWFFYYDLDYLKENADQITSPDDSIMIVAIDDNPVYIYENTGTYLVKLVSKKVSDLHTCVDTFYMEDYIVVDTSFIKVPNVFTPNGDGVNDNFVVKTFSMQSVEISIFNRWGKRIHYWESGNIRGFSSIETQAIWDGRLMGGRYASPGVYYYNVVGIGRDGERRRAHGFFHLFRGKD